MQNTEVHNPLTDTCRDISQTHHPRIPKPEIHHSQNTQHNRHTQYPFPETSPIRREAHKNTPDKIHRLCTIARHMHETQKPHRILQNNVSTPNINDQARNTTQQALNHTSSNKYCSISHNTTGTPRCPQTHRGDIRHSNPHITHTTPKTEKAITPNKTTEHTP